MSVANTTSVYLVFAPPSGETSRTPISLTVEINDNLVFGIRYPFSLVQIAEELNPGETYKFRVTYIGSDRDKVRFEGAWLDRPPSLKGGGPAPVDPVKAAVGTTLGTLVPPTEDPYGAPQQRDSPPLREKPLIELFTSESNLKYKNDPFRDAASLVMGRVDTWYNRLGSNLGADIALIPTGDERFFKSWQTSESEAFGRTPVENIFLGFESSYEKTRRAPFKTYRPGVLILQFGLPDFLEIFSSIPKDAGNVRQHLDWFVDVFVEDYVRLVNTIRTVAYTSDWATSSHPTNADGSYIYNSAPSTLPIFLIVPFSACRIFATRKFTLHKFMSDALARVVSTLQAEGDTSTHHIDTAGWLDPLEDFEQTPKARRWPHTGARKDWRPLTEAARIKVANLLASHICAYIKPTTGESSVDEPAGNGSAVGPAFGDCAFDRYDSYLGNVYVPEGVELDRALLERRIEIMKERFLVAKPGQLKWARHAF
jgi:hypothetical protein